MHAPLLLILSIALGGTAWSADTAVNASGFTPTYTMERSATVVDPNLTVSGTTVPITMMASISRGLQTGDILTCTTTLVAGASASYDPVRGVLTCTGPTTPADWQKLLRSVAFSATTAGTMHRTIVFSAGNLFAGSNGHFYEYVSGPVSWSTARADAATRSHFGATGYLATIGTQDEAEFLTARFVNATWIGGSDHFAEINAAIGTATFADQNASDGHWYWVTGPETGENFFNDIRVGGPIIWDAYYNWDFLEPQIDPAGDEHYLVAKNSSTLGGWWKDAPDAGPVDGYLVEYGDLVADDLAGYSAQVPLHIVYNLRPSANTQHVSTPKNTDLVISLTASDPEGDPLTYSVTPMGGPGVTYQYNAGVRGAAITAANTPVTDSHRVIYAPPLNTVGTGIDVFYFKAHDGIETDTAFVQISVDEAAEPTKVTSDDEDSWLEKTVGCGAGSNLALFGGVAFLALMHHRRWRT